MSKTKHEPQPTDGGYEVGYRKPPVHSRFRPGQSGNPAGRRKGVRNLKTDVVRTLSTPLRVKENGRLRTKSTQEAALLMLREKALRGDTRALGRLLELAMRFNNDPTREPLNQGVTADDQEILAAYFAEFIADRITEPAVDADDAARVVKNNELDTNDDNA